MGRKYARLFVLGHYLFLVAHSFPRVSENCSLLGTGNVRNKYPRIFSHQTVTIVFTLSDSAQELHSMYKCTCNSKSFYLNWLQTFMLLFLFFFSCPFLFDNVSPAVPFVGVWLFIFVMSTLLRTAFSDPGIVPRASAEEAAYIEKTLGEKLKCKIASHTKYLFMALVW